MACTYNPSYLEDRDQEDHHWRPAQAEKLARLSPTSTNKSSIVVGTYNTSYREGIYGRIMVQGHH
jgi:hypothetical protein